MERRDKFVTGSGKPLRSEVVAAWNRMVPKHPITDKVPDAMLQKCLDMMRTYRPERYEYEINRSRGFGVDLNWNPETKRYEAEK